MKEDPRYILGQHEGGSVNSRVEEAAERGR